MRINILGQFILIIPSLNVAHLWLSVLWGCNKSLLWDWWWSQKKEMETIIIHFFMFLKQNRNQIQQNLNNWLYCQIHLPRIHLRTDHFGFFLCLFPCGVCARNVESSIFNPNNCCGSRRFSVILPFEFRPVFSKHIWWLFDSSSIPFFKHSYHLSPST